MDVSESVATVGENDMKIYKKLIIYGIFIFFIIWIVNYLSPRRLNKEYSGEIYRIGVSNYSEHIKINIDGNLYKGLFKGDKFKGTIIIGDKKLLKLDMIIDNEGMGLLFYFEESVGEYTSYGSIIFSNKKDEFTISVFEENKDKKEFKSWYSKEGLLISAPANNRDEALKLSNDLMEKTMYKKNLK